MQVRIHEEIFDEMLKEMFGVKVYWNDCWIETDNKHSDWFVFDIDGTFDVQGDPESVEEFNKDFLYMDKDDEEEGYAVGS